MTVHTMLLCLMVICIIAAAKRCFENERRTFREQQAGKEQYVEEQSKRRKYRSRRERVIRICSGVRLGNQFKCHFRNSERVLQW